MRILLLKKYLILLLFFIKNFNNNFFLNSNYCLIEKVVTLFGKEEIMGNMPVVSINTTLFWQIINFLILVWIFKRFFFKPLSKIIQERKEEIAADIDSAKNDRESANELKLQIEKEMKTAKNEAQKVVEEAVRKAEYLREEILKEAHAQREKMMKAAEADILKMKENAKRELRDEMTEIAVKLAEKMLEKELSADSVKSGQLLEKFIEEVGEIK